MRILGIMSGSSLDGVDMALISFDHNNPSSYTIESCQTFALPHEIKEALRKILHANAKKMAVIQYQYTICMSRFIHSFLNENELDCDFISVHGHTVLHLPEFQSSWQLLNAGQLSSLCKKSVVSDFRNQDMGAGGVGTPMAAIIDRDLFGDYNYCINLGGIANISYTKQEKVIAYDICPCNQVHDFFASRLGYDFDLDGNLAKKGELNNELLNILKQHDYIKLSPPKAIDNNWIHKTWIPLMMSIDLDDNSRLLTHYHFVAETIAEICKDQSAKILMTGGGVKNQYFMSLLSAKFTSNTECIVPSEDIIDYKECILMAYMALKRVNLEYNFINEATGAAFRTCSGALYFYRKS